MAKTNRDDFSQNTKDILAKRAGFLCSNPDCRKLTIGANENPKKPTSIGVASHISAASPGGARYNPSLTPEQRSDISNGIWLCSNCSILIDRDEKKYTIELLHEWKGGVETESRLKLNGAFNKVNSIHDEAARPILEADLTGGGRSRVPRGMSMQNPTEIIDGQLVMVPGLKPIIHWLLTWRYKLIIYNNSSYPAFNVNVESVGELHFSEMQKLNNTNNIPPLAFKELDVEFTDWAETDGYTADEILATRYPQKFDGSIKLKITYYGERRTFYTSYVEFTDGELVNSYY